MICYFIFNVGCLFLLGIYFFSLNKKTSFLLDYIDSSAT